LNILHSDRGANGMGAQAPKESRKRSTKKLKVQLKKGKIIVLGGFLMG